MILLTTIYSKYLCLCQLNLTLLVPLVLISPSDEKIGDFKNSGKFTFGKDFDIEERRLKFHQWFSLTFTFRYSVLCNIEDIARLARENPHLIFNVTKLI
jgi:hypothetical protein